MGIIRRWRRLVSKLFAGAWCVQSGMVFGVISDTHGLLRPEALAALEGVDRIVHAGDVGTPEILDALRRIAPVCAVRGNVDTQVWARTLPVTDHVVTPGGLLYVLHDLKELSWRRAPEGTAVVITGHTHQPVERWGDDGVLYLNPGSAGPRRFKLPISLARLTWAADEKQWKVEFLSLSVG